MLTHSDFFPIQQLLSSVWEVVGILDTLGIFLPRIFLNNIFSVVSSAYQNCLEFFFTCFQKKSSQIIFTFHN